MNSEYSREEVLQMRDKALSVAKHLSINVLGRTWNHPGPFDLDAALALAKSSENQQSVGSQNKLTRIIYVPEDDSEMNYLGLLIGPKGQTQKQMQAESGAKILIRGRGSSKDGHSDSFPEEPLHVYIEAESEEQIAIAEQMVNDLLFDKSKQASVKQSQLMKHAELNSSRESGFILNESLYATGADSGFPLASGGKSVSDTFVVPRDKVGHIIGRGGDTIRLLQQNTGAFIGLSKETRDDDSVTHKVFNILGSEEQVENAKSEIKRLIDEFEEKGRQKSQRPPIRVMDGHELIEVACPKDCVGQVIGKGGQTIKGLMAMTGVHIQLQKEHEVTPDNQIRLIYIAGPPHLLPNARAEVERVIRQAQHSSMLDNSIGSGVGGPMKEVVIHVPGNTVGWIIGKGGANIKNMQMQMNTKVNIDTEDVNNQRKITVRGLAAGVDSTIAEINAIVSQAESSRSNQKVSWDPYDTTSQFIGASAAQNPAFMPAQTPDASASSQDQIALAAVSAVQAAGIDTALISSGDATALSYYQHYYAYYYKQATGQDFPGAHSSNSE